MGNVRSVRQSVAAKKPWRVATSRRDFSIFPFDEYPGIVDFADKSVGAYAQIVTLGGGRGHLGMLLSNGTRLITNVDLARIENPLVEIKEGDMELGLDRRVLNPFRRELVVITPFSLEYTNPKISSRNIAEVLESNELWIWLCHHTDAYLVQEYIRKAEIITALEKHKQTLAEFDLRKWTELGLRAEEWIRTKYPESGDNARFMVDPIEEIGRKLGHALANTHRSYFVVCLVPLLLRLAILDNTKISLVQQKLEQIKEELQSQADVSEILRMLQIRSGEDMQKYVDTRLVLQTSELFSDPSGNPIAVGGVFKKT